MCNLRTILLSSSQLQGVLIKNEQLYSTLLNGAYSVFCKKLNVLFRVKFEQVSAKSGLVLTSHLQSQMRFAAYKE